MAIHAKVSKTFRIGSVNDAYDFSDYRLNFNGLNMELSQVNIAGNGDLSEKGIQLIHLLQLIQMSDGGLDIWKRAQDYDRINPFRVRTVQVDDSIVAYHFEYLEFDIDAKGYVEKEGPIVYMDQSLRITEVSYEKEEIFLPDLMAIIRHITLENNLVGGPNSFWQRYSRDDIAFIETFLYDPSISFDCVRSPYEYIKANTIYLNEQAIVDARYIIPFRFRFSQGNEFDDDDSHEDVIDDE